MITTILIDLYLLYIFFAGGRATPLPQPPKSEPSFASGRTETQDRSSADGVRELRRNVASQLEIFLGYVIALSGIAILIYTALGKF